GLKGLTSAKTGSLRSANSPTLFCRLPTAAAFILEKKSQPWRGAKFRRTTSHHRECSWQSLYTFAGQPAAVRWDQCVARSNQLPVARNSDQETRISCARIQIQGLILLC